MAQTAIGIFDTHDQARAVVERLVSNNFSREFINISDPAVHQERGDVTDENNTLGSKMASFFRGIFDNEDDVLKYTAVAQQGAVVTVQTDSYADAERAAAILNSGGAVNVAERARILETALTREDRMKGYDKRATPSGATTATRAGDERVVNEDRLQEREIEFRDDRLHSIIITRSVAEHFRFHEEQERLQGQDSETK